MKQALGIFSFYSKSVNEKVIGILEKMPEDRLKQDMNTYFKSILDTFVHMTMADINWLGRLNTMFSYVSLSGSPLLQTQADDLKAKTGKDYNNIFLLRREADLLFEELIKEIKDDDLGKIVNYKNKRGADLSHKFGHIIMHLFNHQTHHRGEISAMLDIQKISNDYSGMLNYL